MGDCYIVPLLYREKVDYSVIIHHIFGGIGFFMGCVRPD